VLTLIAIFCVDVQIAARAGAHFLRTLIVEIV
jgi:hypothetical protein